MSMAELMQRRLCQLKEELEAKDQLLREFVGAARGLSFSEDWNEGTHAKIHGYRQKLLDVLTKATAFLGDGEKK